MDKSKQEREDKANVVPQYFRKKQQRQGRTGQGSEDLGLWIRRLRSPVLASGVHVGQ